MFPALRRAGLQQQAQRAPAALRPIFCKVVVQPSGRRQPPRIGLSLLARQSALAQSALVQSALVQSALVQSALVQRSPRALAAQASLTLADRVPAARTSPKIARSEPRTGSRPSRTAINAVMK